MSVRSWRYVQCGYAAAFMMSMIAGDGLATVGSVLELVPDDARAVLHVRNLRQLSDDVDTLVARLVTQGPRPTEVLAKTLARVVHAGFTSDDELADLGFGTDEDFALALSEVDPGTLTALIHVADEERVRAVLQSETAGSTSEHDGVLYHTGAGNAFVFVDDVLVFSFSDQGVPWVIDAMHGRTGVLTQSNRYRELTETTFGERADPTLFVDVAAASAVAEQVLGSSGGSGGDAGPESAEPGQQPANGASGRVGAVLAGLEGIDALGLALMVDEHVPAWQLNLLLGEDSPWRAQADVPNTPLTALEKAPGDAYLVASSMLSTDAAAQAVKARAPAQPDPEAAALVDVVQRAVESLPEGYLAEATVAARFGETIAPDVVWRLPLLWHDPQDFTGPIMAAFELLARAVLGRSDQPMVEVLTDASVELAWGTATVRLATIGANEAVPLGPDVKAALPERYGLWHARYGDDLLIGLGASAATLEWGATAGQSGNTADAKIPERLRERMPDRAAGRAYLSPLMLAKSVTAALAPVVPQMQAAHAVAQFLPDGYSIGVATVTRRNGMSVHGAIDAEGIAPLVGLGLGLLRSRDGQGAGVHPAVPIPDAPSGDDPKLEK